LKKFLSMLLTFLVSLGNSTEYSITNDKPYTQEYYTINSTDSPDYREFYGNVASSSSSVSCKTTNFSAQGCRVVGSRGYWFVNNKTVDLQNLNINDIAHHFNNDDTQPVDYYIVRGVFTVGNYIIMPYKGTLGCDSKTNDCKTMTVYCTADSGVQYKLIFSKMKRWYCDLGKTDESTYHDSDEQNGKVFYAGNVLGEAESDTIVKIIPVENGQAIGTATLKQFYKGEYSPYSK